MSGQSGGYRLRLSTLNEQLICKLCGGYFIDATTIIECLHSFCRSCIVKYLECNKYCPICEVQVHKSKPLLNIRPDHTLQDIVYKIVPGCYQNEMRCRREFYSNHPEVKLSAASPESRGEPIESHIYSPDESLSLSLEYYNPSLKEDSPGDEKETATKSLPKRYLRCPAAVTIFHLQKLIRAKYGLSEAHRVDVMYKEEPLCGSYTLMDVMYIYHWRRKVPLHLSYRIFESAAKRMKLSDDNLEYKRTLSSSGMGQLDSKDEQTVKREWKEVQLKISETGVMSVTDISILDGKKNIKAQDDDGEEEQGRLVRSIGPLDYVNKPDAVANAKTKEIVKPNVDSSKNVAISDVDVSRSSRNISVAPESSKCNADSQKSASSAAQKDIKAEDPKPPEMSNSSKPQNDSKKSDAKASKVSQKSENCEQKRGESDKPVQRTGQQSQKPEPVADSKPEKKIDNGPSILTNNNFIGAETKTESQKLVAKNSNDTSDAAPSTGSKIDGLSAKLQFQPKVGQVNNTYSKKTPKEKKTLFLSHKKAESKISIDVSKNETRTPTESASGKNKVAPKTTSSPSVSIPQSTKSSTACTQTVNTLVTASQASCLSVSSPQSSIYVTSPSVSSATSLNSSSSGKNSPLPVQNTSCQNQKLNSPGQSAVQMSQKITQMTPASCQKSSFSPNSNSLTPMNQSLANIGMNVSTAMPNLGQTGQCFPYTVQNLVTKNPPSKSPSASQRSSTTSSTQASVTSTTGTQSSSFTQFSTQTPSMSIYSITTSTKNGASSAASQTPNTSGKPPVPKTGFEITSIYSVPPCPAAIPISQMKSSVRKDEVIAKGTNLNEICAKIGTSGSKINDICAKIGENSKEKNKTETRNRPEIPNLLKIAKKTSAEPAAKHIPNIPTVPMYTPGNSASVSENKNSYPTKESPKVTPVALPSSASQKVPPTKKPSQPVGYKTLRDPPKSWNPTLSKNNYVAVKNQAKELQRESQGASSSDSSGQKPIASKPAKIFKMRNVPRYLGNPASGVKPMYGGSSETKDKEQASQKNYSTMSMMKIDPKTLSPIVSTANSPIVSPPPYSPNARSYQNTPFPRDVCRNTGSPISPRNSPVNMLATNPFIPSPTPNTNPRLIYSQFPPFPDASRFPNALIRAPIGISPSSAFHNSLPPSINKLYQRSSYFPQTTSYNPTQPPAVQRIPPSTHSSPKSPKTSTQSNSSMFNLAKTETQTSIPTSVENIALHLAKNAAQQEINAFNLSRAGNQGTTTASDLSKTSPTSSQVKQHSPSTSSCPTSVPQSRQGGTTTTTTTTTMRQKSQLRLEIPDISKPKLREPEKPTQRKPPEPQSVKTDAAEGKSEARDTRKEKTPPKLNGDATPEILTHSENAKAKASDSAVLKPPCSKEKEKQDRTSEQSEFLERAGDGNAPSENKGSEDLTKAADQIQGKKSEAQRNKAES